MKRFFEYILIMMLLIPVEAIPQVSVGVFGGLGTYRMAKLKEINEVQTMTVPIEIREIDNFDPRLYIGASVNVKLTEVILLGMNYGFNSTGSRIGLKDYSGYYAYDQIVNGHLFGLEPEVIVWMHRYLTISVSVMSGVIFTSLEMREAMSIGTVKEEDSELFAAVSVPVYPAVKFSRTLYKKLSAQVSAGYSFDTGGKVHLEGDEDAVIKINNTTVRTGWSGFRITAGLRFDFNLVNPGR